MQNMTENAGKKSTTTSKNDKTKEIAGTCWDRKKKGTL